MTKKSVCLVVSLVYMAITGIWYAVSSGAFQRVVSDILALPVQLWISLSLSIALMRTLWCIMFFASGHGPKTYKLSAYEITATIFPFVYVTAWACYGNYLLVSQLAGMSTISAVVLVNFFLGLAVGLWCFLTHFWMAENTSALRKISIWFVSMIWVSLSVLVLIVRPDLTNPM